MGNALEMSDTTDANRSGAVLDLFLALGCAVLPSLVFVPARHGWPELAREIRIGHMKGTCTAIEKIEKTDKELARELMSLAGNYDHDSLRRLVSEPET